MPISEFFRQVAPWASGSQDTRYSAKYPAMGYFGRAPLPDAAPLDDGQNLLVEHIFAYRIQSFTHFLLQVPKSCFSNPNSPQNRANLYALALTNSTMPCVPSSGHLSSKAGTISSCSLSLMPEAAKSKIAALRETPKAQRTALSPPRYHPHIRWGFNSFFSRGASRANREDKNTLRFLSPTPEKLIGGLLNTSNVNAKDAGSLDMLHRRPPIR
jgi:hypothetical protein